MTTGYMPIASRSDWETPPALFSDLNTEFRFTLDVCATAANAKCARFFTPEIDGLAQDWGREICWMNPPYGRELAQWVDKARRSAWAGAIVVCLLPARTDTSWWHICVEETECERRFLRGRLKFVRADGKRSQAPFSSVIVVYRPLEVLR